jgi:L-ascorbate metabolism protein UlaG (beta-lactamase superfamily)
MDLGLAFHRVISKELPTDLYYRVPADLTVPQKGDLAFRWLGAAGFEIEARGRRMLIDPFVTRPTLRQTLFRTLVPDADAVRRYIASADVICAGHSHHDHAMDIGAICAHTGARIYGSESALNAARVTGAPPQLLCHVAAGDVVKTGPFRIRVLRSIHGKVFAGRIPSPGVMGDPRGPLRIRQFKVGATFGLHVTVGSTSFFHLGSADFVESALQGITCDVLLLCIVGRQGSPNFTHRILRTLRPRVVLPCHWDNFFLPFDHPARVMPRCDMHGFLEEVATSGVNCEVAILDFFSTYRYRAQG